MEKSWQDRYDRLIKDFPSIENADWGIAFRKDPDIFTSILADLVKVQNKKDNPGKKKPSLTKDEVNNEFLKIANLDYSDLDFYDTFKALCGTRSIRSVSNRTGLGKSYIYQLLNKQRVPSFETMEKIAKGFKKDPSYFLEYRVGYILFNLDFFLQNSPEIATSWYTKIKKTSNSKIQVN